MVLGRAALVSLLALAPFQCPSRVGPEMAREDTPGDALWQLAEHFRETGDASSRRETLCFLVARYPSSRHTPTAREALGDDGGACLRDAGVSR